MILELKGIYKDYQQGKMIVPVLKDVNFSMEEGEYVAIMGPSGSGKTTLMNIIGCLDTFDAGSYQLDGVNVAALSDEKLAHLRNEKIGFVMQDFALLPHKSVLFNVMLPMYFDQTPRRDMVSKAKTVLEKLGMSAQEKKRVNQLSGGQKQRVALARALVKSPALLLADEPTGALDSQTGKEIMQLLLERNREGVTLIIVTHDEQVAAYCQRTIVISDGKIVQDGRQ